jgi:DNA-binding NarL/FixJ family response regulator
MPTRLLLVDDHDVVRLGLRAALAHRVDFEVCGEAEDGPSALAKVAALAPDLVVLDLSLPVMTGFDTAIQIRRVAPQTKIIVFSIHGVPTIARQCGADAFVSKASGIRELLDTIDRLVAPSERVPQGISDTSPQKSTKGVGNTG